MKVSEIDLFVAVSLFFVYQCLSGRSTNLTVEAQQSSLQLIICGRTMSRRTVARAASPEEIFAKRRGETPYQIYFEIRYGGTMA